MHPEAPVRFTMCLVNEQSPVSTRNLKPKQEPSEPLVL